LKERRVQGGLKENLEMERIERRETREREVRRLLKKESGGDLAGPQQKGVAYS